jgi:hypothetical protein
VTWRSAVAAVGLLAAGAGIFAAGAASTTAPTTDAIDGAGLFVAKGCASCHDGPETTSMLDVGPSLAAASTWASARRAGMDAEAYLTESITSPSAFTSPASTLGAAMPEIAVTSDEVDLLVEHLLRSSAG